MNDAPKSQDAHQAGAPHGLHLVGAVPGCFCDLCKWLNGRFPTAPESGHQKAAALRGEPEAAGHERFEAAMKLFYRACGAWSDVRFDHQHAHAGEIDLDKVKQAGLAEAAARTAITELFNESARPPQAASGRSHTARSDGPVIASQDVALERGMPCEVQDGDPSSPTHRQWLPARFVAVDLIGGEPIVQRDKCMPVFATWGSVRGIKKPTRPSTEQGATPPAPAAPLGERDQWDFGAWLDRLMALADNYYETGSTSQARARVRAALLAHARQCATGWRARSALAASPQPAAPKGWKLVPIDPTNEMLAPLTVAFGCGHAEAWLVLSEAIDAAPAAEGGAS